MLIPSIVDNLYNSTAVHGDNTALHFRQNSISYDELIGRVEAKAAALDALGLKRGDRIAVMLPNDDAYAPILYALLRQGIEVIPVNTLLRPGELRHILQDSRVDAIIASDDYASTILPAVDGLSNCRYQLYIGETTPPGGFNIAALAGKSHSIPAKSSLKKDDAALIFYTAGLSGKARGAVLSHHSVNNTIRGIWETFLYTSEDKVLAALPFFSSLAQTTCLHVPLAAGSTIVVKSSHQAETVLQSIREDGITILVAVPSLFTRLVEAASGPVDNELRVCISAGAPLPEDTGKRFSENFGVAIMEGYGLSECSPLVTCNRIFREQRTGTVGLPMPEIDLAIHDDRGQAVGPGTIGEIVLRGGSIMSGYLNQPEATRGVMRNGWLRTGDVGSIDSDGYLTLVDRKKDLILRGGFHVYPTEVEAVLQQHPGIRHAAVIGVPDKFRGEFIKAFVVPQNGATLQPSEVKKYCQEHIAAYKCPEQVEFIDDLPRSPNGKVLKRALK